MEKINQVKIKDNFVSILREVEKFTQHMNAGWSESFSWSAEAKDLQAEFRLFVTNLQQLNTDLVKAEAQDISVQAIRDAVNNLIEFEESFTDARERISNKSADRNIFSNRLKDAQAAMTDLATQLKQAFKSHKLQIEEEELLLEQERIAKEKRKQEQRALKAKQLQKDQDRLEEEKRKDKAKDQLQVTIKLLDLSCKQAKIIGENDLSITYTNHKEQHIRAMVQATSEGQYRRELDTCTLHLNTLNAALVNPQIAYDTASARKQLISSIKADLFRINRREIDIQALILRNIVNSYFDAGLLATYQLGIQAKNAIQAQYPDENAYETTATPQLQTDVAALTTAFDQVNAFYTPHHAGAICQLQDQYLESLHLVRKDSDLWHRIKTEAREQTKANLAAWVNDQIDAWKTPPIRVWMQAIGLAAVGHGNLRVIPLAEHAGYPTHISLYQVNIDLNVPLSITTAVPTLVDALLPPSNGGYKGLHVTWELFGQNDTNNPRFFRGTDGFSVKPAVIIPPTVDRVALQTNLQQQLTNKVAAFTLSIQQLIAARNADIL